VNLTPCPVCGWPVASNAYGRLAAHPSGPGDPLLCPGSGCYADAPVSWKYVARGRGEGYAILHSGRVIAVAAREDDARDLCQRLNASQTD
jgi:hypothetical protein